RGDDGGVGRRRLTSNPYRDLVRQRPFWRASTKRLRRVRALGPADALYRLVSPPHGAPARGPFDRRREQGVPQPRLQDLGAGGPDGDRPRGGREAPARDREGSVAPGRRDAFGTRQASLRTAGARAAAGEATDVRGPGPAEDRDPALPARPSRCERERDRGGDGLLGVHGRQLPPRADRGPARHEATGTGPPPRSPALRLSHDGPRRGPRRTIPGRGHGIRPK